MAKKLYVGGLSYDTTEDTLRETFSGAGTVESATIIKDKMSGRSKGFGFVEMSSDEEAQKAIEMLNGKELDGRSLTVNEARPMEARPRQGGFDRGGRGGFGGGRDRY
ncbi:MAG: RNA-binding protein [Candidatus Harrisonbacteria bacterium RIFCSPHIGHO2_01_FULL_44_13]|uniref:RNA-binding protein n=1 Tax=Candidatus Harrisonbacteria bacterium RIFCSPLOWO2_01_FULL_44_18 TaxID=1798407 RepID=A0A1G1ZQC3_9BACT|nr:MAG: RNA-binding protein [Candidatus Harrisonbacteria bacterium RIFCSPHIGHO2_01_FULL_44_13]OGY66386.1 MAG: RNA-binding protein [Candidatus Harrisonbacteria bacterium RIFCSPLOWO2_01_FULL_44_18]